MKKRKNKKKKKRRLYIILLILVYLSSFFITIKYSISKKSILINYSLKDNIYINKNSNNNKNNNKGFLIGMESRRQNNKILKKVK